jgi:hypothetical protein
MATEKHTPMQTQKNESDARSPELFQDLSQSPTMKYSPNKLVTGGKSPSPAAEADAMMDMPTIRVVKGHKPVLNVSPDQIDNTLNHAFFLKNGELQGVEIPRQERKNSKIVLLVILISLLVFGVGFGIYVLLYSHS